MRVAADDYITGKLAQANSIEKAAIFGNAGVWYDTVSSLAQLKTINPKDSAIAANWEGLLSSVGLEKIAKAEFVE